MYNAPISFPGLGITVDPSNSFSIGPLTIHWYGLIIAVGLSLAVIYGIRRCKAFGLTVDDLTDGVLCIVPFAILCARLYYCFLKWENYQDDLLSIFYIWEGGLAIYGGVIGAAIGIVVFAYVKKIRVGAVLDVTALGFMIGQSIGRWGNFFNREAFGSETDSFLRMGLHKLVLENGLILDSVQMHYYHPTFLYESVWNAVGFAVLHYLSKKRRYDGQIALLYLAWYGLGRAIIEGLRTDSLMIGSIRFSQLLAAISCVVAVGLLVYFAIRKPDPAQMQVCRFQAKQKTEE